MEANLGQNVKMNGMDWVGQNVKNQKGTDMSTGQSMPGLGDMLPFFLDNPTQGKAKPEVEEETEAPVIPEEATVAFSEQVLMSRQTVLKALMSHGGLLCRRRGLEMLFPNAGSIFPLKTSAEAEALKELQSLVPEPPPPEDWGMAIITGGWLCQAVQRPCHLLPLQCRFFPGARGKGGAMASLSEEMVGEIKEAFELFAGFGGSDTVEAKKLGTLVASLGMNMSDEELAATRGEVARDNVIRLDDFLVFMEKRIQEDHVRQEEELREVFNMLDKDGTGWINMSEIHDVMAKLGSGLEGKFPDTPRSEPPQKENWVDWEKFKEMLGP
eukprot:s1850_g1.t1